MKHDVAAAACLFLAIASIWPSSAEASPWLLPDGYGAVIVRYDFTFARDEFLDDPNASQPYPLRGRLRSSSLVTTLRYGLLDDWEIELTVPVRQVSYTSDPVLLLPAPEGFEGIDYYQENVIDLSRTVVGLGDIEIAARYQLFRSLILGAAELRLKTPTGYDMPAGTFGAAPRTAEVFLSAPRTFVTPENVTDDVTLGDGQVDLQGALMFGWAAPIGTFLRLDTGYKLRFDGAGDQVFASTRVGQLVGSRILLYGGVDGELAVEDGRVIGVSVAAIDPSLPAAEYDGTDNLNLREVTLDRDRISLAAGTILRLTSEVEINMGYGYTFIGRNTAASHTFSLGVGLRTNLRP